jgi:hypothetical protein
VHFPFFFLLSGSLSEDSLSTFVLSIQIACPKQSKLAPLISATSKWDLYNSLSSWLLLILHSSCSVTGPYFFFKSYFSFASLNTGVDPPHLVVKKLQK